MKSQKEESVKAYYNQFSDSYDNMYTSIQVKKFSELFSTIEIPPINWVLDVGGGTGLLCEWMNHEMIVVDISFGMLLSGLSKGRRFQAIAADMQKLPLRTNSISTLYSFTALQNSANPKNSVMELDRIVDSNFLGVVTILSKVYEPEKYKVIERTFNILKFFASLVEDTVFLIQSKSSSSLSFGS